LTETNARGSHLVERVVPFMAEDGLRLNLINVRGEREPHRGPVLLVHGAGVRANIFRAPVKTTIVDALVGRGYDVWLENWRASIDFEPNNWTLDQAARYDHPAAVRTVVDETGSEKVKAIIHCQGSTSFTMSACAGLLPQVDTVVSNAVSLHPVVPDWSRMKLRFAVPVVRRFLRFLNPGWGDDPPDNFDRLLTMVVRLFHHECDNTVCKQVSFTYGSGFPALWRHENLNPATHGEFVPREFGHVPLTFFQQMAKCVSNGHLVSFEGIPGLLDDYVAQPPRTDARFILFAGERNLCFLPESQRRTYEWLSGFRPGYHALHVLPNFSHLDVFMGDAAAQDVFPLMADELEAKVM
jgi:pimeloyl-ACP methyl ester carboxylesterase